MESDELERIRMLENRMRRPSSKQYSNHPASADLNAQASIKPVQDESIKSLKSTDSKRVTPILRNRIDQNDEPLGEVDEGIIISGSGNISAEIDQEISLEKSVEIEGSPIKPFSEE